MDKNLFRSAMRQVAGAVTIVTTRGVNGEPRGVTATAVCSLTVDPPSVIACINRETWVGQFAPESKNFCVNVLARDQQSVAETFAGRTELSATDRFQVGGWSDAQTGAPVLEGAIASFDCELEQAVDFATHVILIGRVQKTVSDNSAAEPLVYVGGAFTTTHPEMPLLQSA
ncbi:flavin reductase family protein [Rhizobium sp. KVB221]|uniref:Flavin reductase family protein n=1 Tax=Rhizobium setariae TaxID=2801340 RepID=A0A936YLR4_9HYPH|nr:flavin reductase family protein [Rhizobium setariae]MBL0372809.1 flavin reductase family protein [Rhizobium setariae]